MLTEYMKVSREKLAERIIFLEKQIEQLKAEISVKKTLVPMSVHPQTIYSDNFNHDA